MAAPTLVVIAHDSIPALRVAIKKTADAAWKQRLKAVLKAREGEKRYEIAKALVASERSIGLWIKEYNEGGCEALKTKQTGRKPGPQRWGVSIFDALVKEIDKGGYWSIPLMREWIKDHFKKDIPEQTVWYRMDQLNYSYKSARPHPMQGNKERQEAFKKGALSRSSRR